MNERKKNRFSHAHKRLMCISKSKSFIHCGISVSLVGRNSAVPFWPTFICLPQNRILTNFMNVSQFIMLAIKLTRQFSWMYMFVCAILMMSYYMPSGSSVFELRSSHRGSGTKLQNDTALINLYQFRSSSYSKVWLTTNILRRSCSSVRLCVDHLKGHI